MLARDDNKSIGLESLRALQSRIGGELRGNRLYPLGPYLSPLQPLCPQTDLQRRWYAVHCEPQQEPKVAKSLTSELRMDAYWPTVPKKVRMAAERYRTVERSMLPGYLFAGFDESAEEWENINGLRGVVRLMMIEMKPVPIAEAVIQHIRGKEAESRLGRVRHGPIGIAIGACVRVLEPFAFAGLFGFVTGINTQQHEICVELDVFGRKTCTWLKPENVEAV